MCSLFQERRGCVGTYFGVWFVVQLNSSSPPRKKTIGVEVKSSEGGGSGQGNVILKDILKR